MITFREITKAYKEGVCRSFADGLWYAGNGNLGIDGFQFVCLSSGSFQMDRAAFAYIILCPCRCSGNGGSKRRSRPNSVFAAQSFPMQS